MDSPSNKEIVGGNLEAEDIPVNQPTVKNKRSRGRKSWPKPARGDYPTKQHAKKIKLGHAKKNGDDTVDDEINEQESRQADNVTTNENAEEEVEGENVEQNREAEIEDQVDERSEEEQVEEENAAEEVEEEQVEEEQVEEEQVEEEQVEEEEEQVERANVEEEDQQENVQEELAEEGDGNVDGDDLIVKGQERENEAVEDEEDAESIRINQVPAKPKYKRRSRKNYNWSNTKNWRKGTGA